MSFGADEIPYSDDQVAPSMISEFDTEPWPGLYDTTRSDIFRMSSWPCFSCGDKGMQQQMQFGPPFAPPCASSMSKKYNVISQPQARYPEDGVRSMSRGAPPDGPKSAELKSVPIEHYQDPGPYEYPDRPYVSASGRQVGCGCMGLIGCRRLPEGVQAGNYPGINGHMEAFGGKDALNTIGAINIPILQLIFMFLLVILVYLSYLHGRLCGAAQTQQSQQSQQAKPLTNV
jgi:hypothetical protein